MARGRQCGEMRTAQVFSRRARSFYRVAPGDATFLFASALAVRGALRMLPRSVHPKRAIIWPFLLVATIFFVSGRSQLAAPDTGFSYDKPAHCLVFGLVATAVVRIPRFRRRGWKGAAAAALVVVLYGGLDEWRQSFTPGRSVELADWAADAVGAVLAVCVYQGWPLYRRLLEWPVPRRGERGR